MVPLAGLAEAPLWLVLLLFALAGAVVWTAGVRLTRYLDAVANRSNLNHAFVGMLLLGGITSLPEVANVITASAGGNPPLAINNLLGSAAINVLLLAIADAFVGRDAATGVVAQPSTMMMATLCILVLILIAGAIVVGDVPLGGVGVASGGIFVASIAFFWLASTYDSRAQWRLADAEEEGAKQADEDSFTGLSDRALWTRVSIAGVLIFAAGYTLSETGDAIAEQTGIGSGMVGFALIGLATSLPELSTILTALKLRRHEMAFGQVLGTNFINLSLILLADIVFAGPPVIDVLGAFEIVSALLGAVLIGAFLVGLLEHRDKTIFKMGYDSAAVMLMFAIGLGLLAQL